MILTYEEDRAFCHLVLSAEFIQITVELIKLNPEQGFTRTVKTFNSDENAFTVIPFMQLLQGLNKYFERSYKFNDTIVKPIDQVIRFLDFKKTTSHTNGVVVPEYSDEALVLVSKLDNSGGVYLKDGKSVATYKQLQQLVTPEFPEEELIKLYYDWGEVIQVSQND